MGEIKAEFTVHLQVRWRERSLRRAPLPEHNHGERSSSAHFRSTEHFPGASQWMPAHIPPVAEGAAVAGGI